MDIGSILLILSLLILVVLFVARPLFDRRATIIHTGSDNREDHDRSALLAQRDRILDALQELDFDHDLGKIPEEDYPAQRAALMEEGMEALRWLDRLQLEADEQDIERRLEAAISARRAEAGKEKLPPSASPSVLIADGEIEARLAARRRERADKSAGFCPQCGRPVQKSDRFCPACGKALA
jgi:hypothetical protein